jgi:hypothetical protein
MILTLILAAALTQAQQQKHDAIELALYARMQAAENAVAEIWRPSPKLLSDYRAARRCYVQFHLYKADGCTEEFDRVDHDLSRAKE